MKCLWSGFFALAVTCSWSCAASQPAAGSRHASQESATAPASPRDARERGVGHHVPAATATDLSGTSLSWRSGRGDKLTVVALTSVTCPLCRKFAPELARIEAAYAAKGVKFIYVNVSGVDTLDQMQGQIKAQGFGGLYLNDTDQAIASTLDARTTTEVFVIDSGNTLVYRGALSDQYGIGYSHDEPRQRFLETALNAALGGKRPLIEATSSPGCALERAAAGTKATAASKAVTYTKDIARIVQNNCVECHRAGGVAPFGLETFEAISKRASMIQTVTHDGIMPPWFAASASSKIGMQESHATGPWANDRSLSTSEKEAIVAWIKQGKPRGDEADLPLAKEFPSGAWSIGTPDAVFQIPEPIAIKADGVMPYQMAMVPTNLEKDSWVRGMQIIPTDKAVVHHVLVFVLPEAALQDPSIRRRAALDESAGFFAAYVPGNDAVVYPQGLAKHLPRKSVLLFQIHYTPNGTATHDQLKIGLLFDEKTPTHVVRTTGISNHDLSIPPNASNHAVHASVHVPADAMVLAFMPHMHVRGKAFRYELEPENDHEPATDEAGSERSKARELLLDIPRYDFNWQLRYMRSQPLAVPGGSTIHATAWYDNSEENAANPDPSKTVRWGQQTFDEMMLGYVEYYFVNEDLAHPEAPPRIGAGGNRLLTFDTLLTRFDANKDGRIERKEVPENLLARFDRLDRSKDGVLTREEFGG